MRHSQSLNYRISLMCLSLLIGFTSTNLVHGQVPDPEEYLRLKKPRQERVPLFLERTAAATDRAIAYLDLSWLRIYTYNYGLEFDYWQYQDLGAASFPNQDGTFRSYYFSAGPVFAVESGPWHSNAMAHTAADYGDLNKIDWEAKDGARGDQFSDPAEVFLGGYNVFAISDREGTWPSTGWPAPESVQAIWAGTETWSKWKRVGDRNAFCVFDDAYADRIGGVTSRPLGIEVRCRSIAYSSMNIVFFQYEFTNTSSNNYTGVYLGHMADKGTPTTEWDEGYAGSLHYDESRQLIWSRSSQYDAATGTHQQAGVDVSFVGFMVVESPTGNFREYPFDPDNPGHSYINDPTQTLTRVALTDWWDRVQNDEQGLYGAFSGRVDLMQSDQARNIWKLSQGGGNPVLKQTVTHYINQYPAYTVGQAVDHFYYVSSGPLSMPAGSSLDYVVTYIGGYSEDEMLDTADKAIRTYNLKFTGPTAPMAPGDLQANGIVAGPAGKEFNPSLHRYPIYYSPSGNITLSFDPSVSITTADPISRELDFEGIRIYRSLDRGLTWGVRIIDELGQFAGWIPAVQWDLEDGITGKDGLSYTHLGDDTGIVSSWTDPNIIDGVEYWYAIAAYDRGEFDGGVQTLRSLESPLGTDPNAPMMVAVIAGSRPNGFQAGQVEGKSDTRLEPISMSGLWPADGTVMVSIVNDVEVTGHTYRLTTVDSGSYGTITRSDVVAATLQDLTAGLTLFSGLLPDDVVFGSNLLPVIDGFKVTMNTLFNTVDADDRITYNELESFRSYPDWFGHIGYGDAIAGGSIYDQNDPADAATIYPSVEIRFSQTQTQMAYVYTRDQGTWNYPYQEYHEFPGTVWDISSVPERQLNISYTVNSSDTTNSAEWDIDTDPTGENSLHLTAILASDYSGMTPDTIYTTGIYNSWQASDGIDVLYKLVPGLASGTVADLEGEVLRYSYARPIGPGWTYEFSTSSAMIEDTQVDLEKIRVVPNPYYIYAEWDQSANRRKIQFTNVPAESEIRIYTLTGELVAILDHHGDATASTGDRNYNSNRIGTVDWNLWTYEFTEAAYGLYIFVVKLDNGRTKVGKFAIIR